MRHPKSHFVSTATLRNASKVINFLSMSISVSHRRQSRPPRVEDPVRQHEELKLKFTNELSPPRLAFPPQSEASPNYLTSPHYLTSPAHLLDFLSMHEQQTFSPGRALVRLKRDRWRY